MTRRSATGERYSDQLVAFVHGCVVRHSTLALSRVARRAAMTTTARLTPASTRGNRGVSRIEREAGYGRCHRRKQHPSSPATQPLSRR
jgi:hypothetical protein